MSFYLMLFVLVTVSAFSYSRCKDKYLSVDLKLAVFLLMFIPSAIRFNIGTDYVNYLGYFYSFARTGNSFFEVGWTFLESLILKLGLHYQWLFVISSFLIFIWVLFIDKKYFFPAITIFFLYFYTFSYNGVRNSISVTLFFLGYISLIKNKKLKGFLLVLAGTLFHSSAWLCVLIYLLMSFVKLSKKKTLIIALIIYIVFFKFQFAQNLLKSSLLGATKYAKYAASLTYNKVNEVSSGLGVLLRHFVLFFTYCLTSEKKVSKREFSAMSVLFLSLLIADILATQIYAFGRLKVIFSVAYMAMFINLYSWKSKNVFIEIGKIICFLYSFLLVFVLGLLANQNEIVPYTSILGVW